MRRVSSLGLQVAVLLLSCATLVACKERRVAPAEASVWEDVRPIFEARCVQCHGQDVREASWSAESYLESIGCIEGGQVATLPASDDAPVLRALEREDHKDLLATGEEQALRRWIHEGAKGLRGTVHPAGIIDPRDADWHGKLAASRGWGPLHDSEDTLNCGRCHEGNPSRPPGVTSPAPNATACSQCHDGRSGVLGCTTCHGDDGEMRRSYPPRDACYFAKGPRGGAHATHVDNPEVRTEGYACGTCHPSPGSEIFGGEHADGEVQVRFDAEDAGEDGVYNAKQDTCSVGCHAHGGTEPEPRWSEEGPLDCGSCHGAPPEPHFPGTCDRCHAEMGSTPDSLTPGKLHMNGVVDLGDGRGDCRACHTDGESPWPASGAHPAHRATTWTTPVACGDCHPLPSDEGSSAHFNGIVDVALRGRALHPDLTPIHESGGCSQVACHAAWLAAPAADPTWNAPRETGCLACHGAPPPSPHPQDTGCSALQCHGDEVGGSGGSSGDLDITEPGREIHIDGEIQFGR